MDYESNNLNSKNLDIRKTSFIYRENNTVISDSEKNNKKKDLLFQIIANKNNKGINFELLTNPFKLEESSTISQNSPWFLFKSSIIDKKSNRYKLNPGDIIKIGRITLRIRDIKFSNNNNNNSLLNDSNNTNIKEMNTLKTEGEREPLFKTNSRKNNTNNNNDINKALDVKEKVKPIVMNKNSKKNNIFSKIEKKNNLCRICYMEEEDSDNPLLQPCICSGSMKFIHLTCLKQWISTRSCVKIDTTDNCSVYIIKEVECELCKTKFPDFIKHEGKLYALLDFSKEYENYLTLESLTLDKHKNKFIYVVSLIKNRKMKMGRGHVADVLLSDISVSRIHCYLVVDNKKVYLEDNNSKFGSLILIQYSNIKILDGLTLYFQVGRTYIECKIKRDFKLFNCCDIEENSNLFYYYNQNEKHIQQHMNLIVKRDYNEMDNDSENNFKINNTFEQKNIVNIDEKYNYLSIDNLEKDKDKISDNEYFMMKHNKLNKNLTRALIDEEIGNDKKVNNDENNDKNKNTDSEEENENEEDGKKNKSENNNSKNDRYLNNENENENENVNENENDNDDKNKEENRPDNSNQEDVESICVSENNETL